MSLQPASMPIPLALQRLRADLDASAPGPWPRGVIGAHATDGRALYAYPEIAGYWLQWASRRTAVAAVHGTAVLDWLAQAQLPHGGWPTRIGAITDDPTYAAADYLYDHAMLWQGLQAWGQWRGDPRARALGRAAWAALDRYLDGGQLRVGRGALPPRWSGQGGPFLLKALAYLRHGEGRVARAAQAAIPDLAEQALACPHREAHPQLYAIEGLLLLGEFDMARRALQALLDAHGGPPGLRESVTGGARRSDVLAQALRAALLLDAGAASMSVWQRVALELAERVDGRGRIPFAPRADACPTWAALFVEQALALYSGEPCDADALI